MIFDVLQSLLNDIFPSLNPGKHGEELIESIIQRDNIQAECHIKTLRNIYFFNGKYSTEIDVVAVTEKGIFVIESKNYGGWIFGDENGQKWMQTFPNGSKHQFYNPIKQNEAHRRRIYEFLHIEPSKVFSYIVFASRSEFKQIPGDSSQVRILKCNVLESTLKNDLHHLPTAFSKEEVDTIYWKLFPLTQRSEEEKQNHVEFVRKFTEGKECPVCGSALELVEYKDGIGKYKCIKCAFERTDNIDVQGAQSIYIQYRRRYQKKDAFDDFLFGNLWEPMGNPFRSPFDDIFGEGERKGYKSDKRIKDPFLRGLKDVEDELFSGRNLFSFFDDKPRKRSSYGSKKSYSRRSSRKNDFGGWF